MTSTRAAGTLRRPLTRAFSRIARIHAGSLSSASHRAAPSSPRGQRENARSGAEVERLPPAGLARREIAHEPQTGRGGGVIARAKRHGRRNDEDRPVRVSTRATVRAVRAERTTTSRSRMSNGVGSTMGTSAASARIFRICPPKAAVSRFASSGC